MDEPVNAMRQSPAEREAAKSPAERAQDFAYTINHAISCGTNDMLIAPTISALFGVQVGCSDPSHDHGAHDHHDHHAHDHKPHDHHGHDHKPHGEPQYKRFKPVSHTGHNHGTLFNLPGGKPQHPAPHVHAHAPAKFSWKLYRSEAFHYLRGEIIGDMVAVPLTIGVQRFFPSVMDTIRRVTEPLAGPFFRKGADAAAKKWGGQQGLDTDAPQVVARAQAMYENEMKHLPQAVTWNVFAFAIGVFAQRKGGHASSYARIIRNKSIGAVISNTLLLGSRAVAPNVAEQWDAMNGHYIVAPVSNFVTSTLGMQPANWSERVTPQDDTVSPRSR